MKNFSLRRTAVLFAVPLLLWLVLQRANQTRSRPERFVSYTLAGVGLIGHRKWSGPRADYGGRYDFARNYSIRDSDGPDGCEYVLELAPGFAWGMTPQDQKEMKAELLKELKGKKPRLPLVTGHGVAIGDTIPEVIGKIGPPYKPLDEPYEGRQSLVYRHVGKRLYEAHYDFFKGRLRAIHLRDAAPPGKYNPNGGCS